MNKRVIIISIGAIVLIGLTVMKLKSNKTEVDQKIYIHDVTAAILVEATKPSVHTFESSFSFLGTFEPIRQNTIGSDANGKIIKLNIEEGDKVSQGQILAKVDDEMLQLQLQNVEVSIEGQKNDDSRYSNLIKENAIAEVQVEKTKLGLKSAEIQKKQIQKQLKSTNITAPFSGVITKKMVDLGSVIGAGSPIAEITDISNLKLTVNVPERDILKFKLNQTVQVSADIYGKRQFTGKVTNVSVQADKSHNFKVQITVKNTNQELMAGMYGSVSLENSKSVTALSIPRKALVGSSKNPQVYVIKNGKSILTSFNAGTSDGEYIEVVDGISKNDQIIIKGQVNLQNNSNVKIAK
ncbi:MAG: efflux RND transporter periplasmic adaptor subunit [Crocinitomicaceae bacterium]|nr:MAG: efflux RND transporter periplasmic adaptor subunit [Crocinitomicaceae bacterium]